MGDGVDPQCKPCWLKQITGAECTLAQEGNKREREREKGRERERERERETVRKGERER